MRGRAAGALLLVACGTSAPPPARSAPAPTPAPASFAAFAIYSGDATVLVPVDPAREVVAGDGFWVADPERPARIVHAMDPVSSTDVGLPECPCSAVDHACIGGTVIRELDASDGDRATVRGDCACWGPRETPRPPTLEIAIGPEGMRECDPPPPNPDMVVSFVGGVIFRVGESNSLEDECGNVSGFNVYDAYGEEQALLAPLRTRAIAGGWQHCAEGHLTIEELFGADAVLAHPSCPSTRPAPDPEDDDAFEAWEETNDACRDCDEELPDLLFPVLGDGRLCEVGLATTPPAVQLSWVACAPLDRDNCPSAVDPCGDPAPFRDRLEPEAGFWVSTDGRWALTGDGRLLAADTTEPVRTLDPIARPLGVLFFAEAGPLAAAMTRASAADDPAEPPDTTGPPCDEGGACPEGMVCDRADELCWPRCASDSDCSWRGRCGATCEADGRCGPAPDGACDPDEGCPTGYRCSDDAICIECAADAECDEGRVCVDGACAPPLCASDDDCDDGRCAAGRCARACEPGSASDLGNACALRMREGAWDEARRLCECALAASPTPRTEGALRYNLGRVAEEQGDRAEAARQYRRSLAVRPGNAAVRSRLEALGP